MPIREQAGEKIQGIIRPSVTRREAHAPESPRAWPWRCSVQHKLTKTAAPPGETIRTRSTAADIRETIAREGRRPAAHTTRRLDHARGSAASRLPASTTTSNAPTKAQFILHFASGDAEPYPPRSGARSRRRYGASPTTRLHRRADGTDLTSPEPHARGPANASMPTRLSP